MNRQILLDTETTGLSNVERHRIVEIGCIELNNQIPTNNIFHEYINPQRPVSEEAYKIHGYSDKFLSDKNYEIKLNFAGNILIKLNSEVIECFLEDISDPWETKNKPKHDPFND